MAEEEKSSEPKIDDPHIDTGGGTFVKGNVDTGGGEFVGRDKIIQIGSIRVPRALARWIAASLGVIAVVSIVGTSLQFGIFRQVSKPTPVPPPSPTATITPTPSPTATATATATPQQMSGDFRILVAQFGTVDENQNVSASALGEEISNWLARRLDTELTTADTVAALGDVTVWHDDFPEPQNRPIPPVGVIYYETEAARVANEIKAMFVIYGVLSPTVDTPELQLSFYYNVQQVRDEPDAAIGRHQFGNPVPIAFSDPVLARENLDSDGELKTRIAALIWLSKALTKEAAHDPQAALDIYRQGEALLKDWNNPAAKSVFYFFMGRTALSLKDLPEAERTLQLAVQDNDQNANAHIGLGNYYFTLAQLYAARNQPLDPELLMCSNLLNGSTRNPPIDVNQIAANSEAVPKDFEQLSATLQRAQEEYELAIDLASQPQSLAAQLLPIAQVMLATSQRLQGEYEIAEYQLRQSAGNDEPALLAAANSDLESAAALYPQTESVFQSAQRFGFLAYTYNGMGLNSRAQGALAQLQQNTEQAKQDFQQSLEQLQKCDALKEQKDPDGNSDLQQRTACYCRYYEQKVEQDYIQLGGGQG